MKIQFEKSDTAHEIADFIFQRNSSAENLCHLCPQDRGGIIAELDRLFGKPEPRVLTFRTDAGELQGVFHLYGILEERYFEIDWGFAADASVYDALIAHLCGRYPGFHLDAVVTKSNRCMYDAYLKNGLTFQPEQILMDLAAYTPKPVPHAAIIRYAPEYEASYRAIHKNEGLYWTADRMLQALDQHDVYIAVENGAAVGYIEMSAGGGEISPLQLFVKPECRGKGYGRALLQTAIETSPPGKFVLDVDADNAPALHLYLSLGFSERLREYLGSRTL